MKKTHSLFLLAVALFSARCITAQTDTKVNGNDAVLLMNFRADYIKSKLENKPEQLLSYYADTIRLMTEFQHTVVGKGNVLKYHQAFAERFEVKTYSRKEIELLNLGRMIVEHGQFVMKVKSKTTGVEYQWVGKYQNIWERNVSGKLQLITDGWNYDQSLDIGEELRFPQIPVVDVALQPHLPVTNAIRFELTALNRLAEATISQHDAKLWSLFYTDDAILFAQRRSLQRGRQEIDAYIEQHVAELPVFEKLDIRHDRIDDLGTYVIEYASHIACWRNGVSSGIGLGKDLRIWRREKNGSLKIFRHIGMYD